MQKTEINDRELVLGYLKGNDACLEMLIKRHKRKIFSTILNITNDRYIAEDIFQETFIRVIGILKSGTYAEEGKFLPWVLRIARNKAIDHFRRSKRNPHIVGEDGEEIFRTMFIADENREERMIREQNELDLRKLIHLLPYEQKEVLVMRHYANLSFKEIADVTDVSINTALGRMRYALNNLRKLMVQKQVSLQ